MTEEMDNILRKLLDEVDRTRKRQWAYLASCLCCLLLYVWSIMVTAHNIGECTWSPKCWWAQSFPF
jgi:hypothetical protein